ncbi:ABC transporter ATP-binding protein [Verrucomicrobiaceae bacterium R5-34]|uniref:ABC transporter ATP-binding protein n=1 Tax=Oceaniferula flava TaxID=2800421 RepID=A0AAE2S9T2_9BACT|nr:ABC transporter ATP-binding protein [Oceaniferula flavus]MBK1829252.1 ABC transporter ATP-binding protein [Verrucomicrobiaceae bacterium R5-34]MBK1853489.1 ABC transporter ATP-binding protein [Oceaniferula flavus]MBM1134794.1 ABC transporter ATP-binding protein [Oceaniferula flavus]
MSENLLEVKELITAFRMEDGDWLRAVDGVSFRVPKGKTVGVVGESGCGKSVTAMSVVSLLPKPMGHVLGGEILFKGEDLTKASDKRMHQVRGGEIGVIFQEPMTALNPVHRIGKQISESLILHRGMSKREALQESIELLDRVGIPAPERRVMEYPHQLSGGMRQRVVIAIALACKPDLLIADEPTTALDVTVQSQILELMEDLQNEMGMSTILITHDLGVIAGHCDEVVVMYAGRVVERAPVKELYASPQHAYTRGLLNAIPTLATPRKSKLNTIEGQVASIKDFVTGCRFCQRMERKGPTLKNRAPFVEISKDHWVEACPECVDTSALNLAH